MPSEAQKMRAGLPYQGADPELAALRERALGLCAQLQGAPLARRVRILQDLLGTVHENTARSFVPPFHCDYGSQIHLAEGVFINAGAIFLDVCDIRIGARTLIGPGVHIYTATHPLSAEERRSGLESGQPVTIGEDVWIGGGAIICPGVHIGDRTVIGAGAVVTRSLPADVVAVGNPARVQPSSR